MKYVITGDLIKKYQNDDGIVFMDVFDFLLDKDSSNYSAPYRKLLVNKA